MRRPGNKHLKEMIEYLENIGLEIVGLNYDLETGDSLWGMRNYDSDDVVIYRKMHERELLSQESPRDE